MLFESLEIYNLQNTHQNACTCVCVCVCVSVCVCVTGEWVGCFSLYSKWNLGYIWGSQTITMKHLIYLD